tara:strand:- start:59616 stop:60191 length:576 start_codon:yes stop_codon:yes gene_type:complete
MIQRVQNLYLFLALVALIIVTIGTDVFVTTIVKKESFELTTHANVYGVQRDISVSSDLEQKDAEFIKRSIEKVEVPSEDLNQIPTLYFPFYSIGILLSMLAAMTILSYKKLKRQIKLGRVLFVFNFLSFGTILVLYYLLKQETSELGEAYIVSNQLGFGFYCIVIATAFSFLANIGIRRDIKLIQSIDRIR